jgi:hypothetical protein
MVCIEDSAFAGLDSADTNETPAPQPQPPKLIGVPFLGSSCFARDHQFWDLPAVLASADEEADEEEEEDDFDYFDDEDEEDDELDEEDEFEEEEFDDEEEEDEEEDDEDF